MEVEFLKEFQYRPWLLKKHYAKKIPSISYCFGLIIDKNIEGICTFGSPASRFVFSKQPYELNRLVVNEGLGKNILSQFVSKCLKIFPESSIIVSYADANQGHHGYIYQATNWVYTGVSSKEKNMFINGEKIHRRTLNAKYGTSSVSKLKRIGFDINFERQEGKHRYFQFTGSKKEKKLFKKEVLNKYKQLPYPKGDNKRYQCDFDPKQRYDKNAYKIFF